MKSSLSTIPSNLSLKLDDGQHMSRRTPTDYEKFISMVVENLKPRYAVDSVSWGSKNRLQGRSGVFHQIDVSFIDRSFGEPKLVLFECKSLRSGKRVNLGQIKTLKSTIDDLTGCPQYPHSISAHMISSAPLQSGALAYSKFYGIGSQLVSDGLNWTFRYERMLQVGLDLQGAGAKILGTANIQRKCRTCQNMFCPVGSEIICSHCSAL